RDACATKRPEILRPADQVLRQVLHFGADGEALERGDEPDADGLVEPDLDHLPVELVPLLLALELAPVQPLAQVVELLVLVLPEADLLPTGHLAKPRRVELVDTSVVVARGRAPAPPL